MCISKKSRATIFCDQYPACRSTKNFRDHKRWQIKIDRSSSFGTSILAGWNSSKDVIPIPLSFATREAAERYAEKNNLIFDTEKELLEKTEKKSYADVLTNPRKI